MKTNRTFTVLLLTSFVCCSYPAFSQKNKSKPLDSALEANSEKWKVKLNKGFGLGKPEFGPYTTSGVEKTDSPVFKKRTKTGSYVGFTTSSDGWGWDWDFSKYETIEKAKAFRTIVASETDTAQLLFSIYRISKEKNPTFFGELINNEAPSQVLGYKTVISGIIATSYDSVPWRFLIEDTLGRRETSGLMIRNTSGYMLAGADSLYAEPIVSNNNWPGTKYSWESQKGVFINNATGDRVAALKFGEQGNLSNPFFVWMRKDTAPVKQHVIASFFSLMMIAKMYSQNN